MNNIYLYYLENKKKLFSVLIIILILMSTYLILFNYGMEKLNNYFLTNENAMIITVKKDNNEIQKYLKNNQINNQKLNLKFSTTNNIMVKEKTDQIINLKDLKYNDEITKQQKLINQKKINNFNFKQEITYNYLNIPKTEKKANINLTNLGIKTKLVGNYPSNNHEVLIGENEATFLLNNSTSKSYQDLINQELLLDNKKYQITGIYESEHKQNFDSEDVFILEDGKKIKENTYYLNFNSLNEQQKFLKKYNDDIEIHQQKKYLSNYIYLITCITILITLFIIGVILFKSIKKQIEFNNNFIK